MEPVKSIWMDGELVPWAEANVHVLSHGLHYGTGVFEGIRAYGTDEGTAVFRLADHMQRLHDSAAAYSIPMKYSVDELIAGARQLVLDNELDSAYIRPIVFYGSGTIGLNPSGSPVVTSIVAFNWGAYLGEEGLEKGISVKIASLARISPSSFPSGKATGPYINSVLANQEATSQGYDEALLLTEAGNVSEGSGENVFVVTNGEVLTPPLSDGCLNGITRQSIVQLLADDGTQVIEKSMTKDDLYAADELFFTGTAAEVTPIRHIDDQDVGDGTPGPVTKRTQGLFRDAVGGKLAAYQDWLDYV